MCVYNLFANFVLLIRDQIPFPIQFSAETDGCIEVCMTTDSFNIDPYGYLSFRTVPETTRLYYSQIVLDCFSLATTTLSAPHLFEAALQFNAPRSIRSKRRHIPAFRFPSGYRLQYIPRILNGNGERMSKYVKLEEAVLAIKKTGSISAFNLCQKTEGDDWWFILPGLQYHPGGHRDIRFQLLASMTIQSHPIFLSIIGS